MSDIDEQIGRNLARLRGDVSQIELAKRMRERGWKWGQNTVSAIEVGERALRLAEARDVVTSLGGPLESVSTLLSSESRIDLQRYLTEMRAADDNLRRAVERWMAAQLHLAMYADRARSEGTETAYTQMAVQGWLETPVDDVVRSLAVDEEANSDSDIQFALDHNARTPDGGHWLNLMVVANHEMTKREVDRRRKEGQLGFDPETS